MEAGKRTIEQIFNKGRTLQIPFFQRSYVWEEENWERFLDDMQMVSDTTETSKQYFMGPLILKSQPVTSERKIGDLRLVVDGQQRLTTIVLFFKALCEASYNNEKKFMDTFFNRNGESIIEHNHNDIEVYEAILGDRLDGKLKKRYESNNVLKCYHHFQERSAILKSIDINKILNLLCFVGIDLGEDDDEQQIFDTLNSLGVSLTTAELLKNELYRKEDEDLYNKTWKKVFEKDEDARIFWDFKLTSGRQFRASIDLFLQSFLIIKSKANDKYLMLSSLFTNYKAFLKDQKLNKHRLIESLIEYAKIYRDNVQPLLLKEDINQNSTMQRLNIVVFGLNTTTVVPYILYILKEVEDSKERENIFQLLESYLIRRLICKQTTKNYNNLFASFIRNRINTFTTLKDEIYKGKDPTNLFPDDSVLKNGFQNNNLTNQQAQVVLYLIEVSIRSTKDSTKLLPFNHYSVEHVMPKNWRNYWDSGLSAKKAEQRDAILLKFGNLTIITRSLNSSIRDADWKTKKNGKGNNKGLIEYCAGIKTFSKYLQKPTWNEGLYQKEG